MATESLEQKVKNLENTVESFKHEIERLQAVNEIQNLLTKYEHLHMTNRQKDVIKLYAKNASTSISFPGMASWKGPTAPDRAWGSLERTMGGEKPVGMMAIHPTTTPLIEVAGDGKTAKGVWITTGFVARVDRETGEPTCGWEWSRVGVDFIKEDGKWKIWHYLVYWICHPGWDDKWAEQFTRKSIPVSFPDESKPDEYLEGHQYSPDTVCEQLPRLPEPYETWDKTFTY